jgi:hypothetical protein
MVPPLFDHQLESVARQSFDGVLAEDGKVQDEPAAPAA